MSSFEDIKVDDKVIVNRKVGYSWGSAKSFWVLTPIDKITPKQFVVDGVKYRKDDGQQVGGYGMALKPGEKEDQYNDWRRFSIVVSKSREVSRLFDLGFDLDVMTVNDAAMLEDILKRCTKVRNKL